VEHPKDVGDRSTLAIMLALRSAGYSVLMPFGENTRYDLVIDDGESLARVQCKTGRLLQGAITFRTSSTYLHHPHPKVWSRDYHGEVDYFAVYCPATAGVYLVPIADLATNCSAMLRVAPPRNNQVRGVRYASRYEIARIPIEGLRGPSGA